MSAEIVLGEGPLTVDALIAVVDGAPVRLGDEARARIAQNHTVWLGLGPPDILARKETWLLGIEGTGAPQAQRVSTFVRCHCAGVGPPLATALVRALMLTRASQLSQGLSGVRPELIELLLAMLNAGVHPVIPSLGSVGAAGDLAPLAHLAEVAFRLGGKAERGGVVRGFAEAMEGVPSFTPEPKEALSLINGATLTAAMGALAVHRVRRLLRTAERTLSMSMEVVLADAGCLDPRALASRGHPAAVESAARVAASLEGSTLVQVGRSPDAFSVRCAPAVHGAAWDALEYTERVVVRELNGACDNPLVFEDGAVEAGNFHGAPVAITLDHLKVALTQVISIAERRVYRLTYGRLTGNLPSFLLEGSGVNNGFMLAQYTAASLVSECKGRCFPASADSIPTGQHAEDHVPMGPNAARGLLHITEDAASVLAIEALVAAQGLEFRRAGRSFLADGTRVQGPEVALAPAVAAALATVRAVAPLWVDDRVLHGDLAAVATQVRDGAFAQGDGGRGW
ncbi:MAG: aromatic amino acid lyase [Deltaproteobacteria bacterium]|nr:aromatic amino acid lyase [Deltaproteobacteria bacterium]